MNIILSYDYELFFGKNTGTVDNCLIKPTERLFDIAENNSIKLIFFIDIPYLLKLKELSKIHKELEIDYLKIKKQLKKLKENGHDLELHIHPHWYDSDFDGAKWVLNTSKYKLSDFSDEDAIEIINDCVSFMKNELEVKPVAFRAGGWSLEPFDKYSKALLSNGINVDSTVYKGGYDLSQKQYYDFRKAPDKTLWTFSNDPTVESEGEFIEIPITSKKNYFFESILLSLKYRMMRKENGVSFGDGYGIKDDIVQNKLKKILIKFKTKYTVVPLDGTGSCFLLQTLRRESKQKNKKDFFVAIGHPKSQSRYSLKKLEEFIIKTKNSHVFTTYKNFIENKNERIEK